MDETRWTKYQVPGTWYDVQYKCPYQDTCTVCCPLPLLPTPNHGCPLHRSPGSLARAWACETLLTVIAGGGDMRSRVETQSPPPARERCGESPVRC